MIRSAQNFSRNMDWNLLKTFHEITEAGGVSRAVRAMRRKFAEDDHLDPGIKVHQQVKPPRHVFQIVGHGNLHLDAAAAFDLHWA